MLRRAANQLHLLSTNDMYAVLLQFRLLLLFHFNAVFIMVQLQSSPPCLLRHTSLQNGADFRLRSP